MDASAYGYEARCGGRRRCGGPRHGGGPLTSLIAASQQGEYGPGRQGGGPITGLIGALQQIRLGASQQQPPMVKANPYEDQTRGVAYPSAADEKRSEAQQQNAQIHFEELPSYDESIGARSPPSQSANTTTRGMPSPTEDIIQDVYQPNPQKPALPRSNTEQMVARLADLHSSVQEYRSGADDRKWVAKKAAKRFVKDLYAQEMEKRKAQRGGYLECGERKEIKRELKPVKQMLKAAVWEAKQQRKGYC